MSEEGHLHTCEVCDDYYQHDDCKCNKYTTWAKCEKHAQNGII